MSEVKTMSSIQFPNTQQPYQVQDQRIPVNPGNYQYLVTDGEGNTGWADRLAWKEGEKVEITWDGNTEGKEIANYGNNPFCLVSTSVPSNDVIKTGVLTVPGFGDVAMADMWSMLESSGYATEEYVFFEAVLFARVDNVEIDGNVFPKAGVWFDVSMYPAAFVSGTETIHPIPAEYITGAPLTETDNGKVLGVVGGAFGLVDALPSVTTDNDGQFLRVANGAWAAVTVPNAEGVSF